MFSIIPIITHIPIFIYSYSYTHLYPIIQFLITLTLLIASDNFNCQPIHIPILTIFMRGGYRGSKCRLKKILSPKKNCLSLHTRHTYELERTVLGRVRTNRQLQPKSTQPKDWYKGPGLPLMQIMGCISVIFLSLTMLTRP